MNFTETSDFNNRIQSVALIYCKDFLISVSTWWSVCVVLNFTSKRHGLTLQVRVVHRARLWLAVRSLCRASVRFGALSFIRRWHALERFKWKGLWADWDGVDEKWSSMWLVYDPSVTVLFRREFQSTSLSLCEGLPLSAASNIPFNKRLTKGHTCCTCLFKRISGDQRSLLIAP